MPIPETYKQEFFQQEPLGNNAFDYDQRASSHPEPYLRVAPLKAFPDATSALLELRRATSPAFEIVEEGQLKSFPGLQNFLFFPNPTNLAPIFIFDNHNHAFFFWHWWTFQNQLKTPFDLIHIDQHKDSRIPATIITPEQSKDEKSLHQYTNEILNVGNFIPPAIKTGLISTVQNIDSSTSLQKFLDEPLPENYILDLDLDFFAPDLDFIDNQQKITAIRKALTKATITTIATSPFFLDDQLAFSFLKKIFSPTFEI